MTLGAMTKGKFLFQIDEVLRTKLFKSEDGQVKKDR
jgi:hypothetical protein